MSALAPATRITRARQKPAEYGVVNGEQHLLLHDVSWQQYEKLGEIFRDRSGLRMTYDQGGLEIMTLSAEHESFKSILDRLIEVIAEELGVPLKCLGSTTYKQESLEKGLEPDECYYLDNYARIQGKKRIDLSRDPPPDLAVEIDTTRSSLDRMAIYAKLGVSEIWRFDGHHLTVFQLSGKGKYREAKRSRHFPSVPIAELARFVHLGETQDDTSIVKQFRQWLRSRVARAES
jgi:Uma2 family endonuclease